MLDVININRKFTLHDGNTIQVGEVSRHRNGVGGDGFHEVRFTFQDPEEVTLRSAAEDAAQGT